MNLISTVSELLDDPQDFILRAAGKELGWAGVFGYLTGIFSLFTFLRLFSAVPPGVYSFLNILVMALGLNFFFASGIHLFLEMTGAGGSASLNNGFAGPCPFEAPGAKKDGNALKLFFLFGLTELFWAVLIPLAFMSKLDYLNPALGFLLCFIFIVVARISLIRRLYSISRPKALLSVAMPYAAIFAGFSMLFVYSIVYMVWLVI